METSETVLTCDNHQQDKGTLVVRPNINPQGPQVLADFSFTNRFFGAPCFDPQPGPATYIQRGADSEVMLAHAFAASTGGWSDYRTKVGWGGFRV